MDREAAGMRRDELLDTFERMVAYAAEQDVRVILIAGDLFDKPNVRKTAKTRVIEQIKGHPQIDFAISGATTINWILWKNYPSRRISPT